MRDRPTSKQVQAYRETHQCGLAVAQMTLLVQWRRECLQDIRAKAGELYTVEQCRDVIVDLLDLLAED